MRPLTPLLLVLAIGCRDTLSGPEAQRLGTAFTDPWTDSSQLRLSELWTRLSIQPLQPDSVHPGEAITPSIDGKDVPARALVFELAFAHQAAMPAACAGNRLTLVGWTLAPVPEGFILTGGDFAQPLARPTQCESRLLPTRQPAATLRPMVGPEDIVWVAQAGSATIEPITTAIGCPFVSQDGVIYLAQRGVQCSAATYAVGFQASFQPSASSPPTTVPRTLGLAPVRVAGVRWTVDCAVATEWAVSCGQTTY